jgi:hypothetical protein
MFNSTIVPYSAVVAAARDTAERICARGSRRVRISVTTLGGTTASVRWDTSEATLNLPTMPASQMLSRAEANQIVGLIAHECCHVMHTSWPEWLAAIQLGAAIKELTNGIEDVRIEALEIARKSLPGLKDALSDTMTMMHGKSLAACAERGTPIGAAASDASYVIAILGRLKNGYNVPCAKGLRDGIDPKWLPAIDHALARLPMLASTASSRILAQEVLAMLQAATPAPAPQPQPQPQDSQDGESDPTGSQDGQDGESDPTGSQDGQDGDGDGDGDGDWLNASPNVDDIAADKGAEEISEYDNKALKRTLLNNFRQANYRNRGTENDPFMTGRIKHRIPRPAVLADSVSRLVLSEARNTNDRYLTAGRFDRRAIGRASWGATNVFARRAYAPGIETAVFLLLDGSDSMRGASRMLDAQSLAYHLGQAIDDAGAQCAIGAFYADGEIVSAFDITIAMAKDWQEPVDLGRIAALGPTGTTPLSPAIIAAAEQLAALDVDRRICLPLTDGGCDLGTDAVRDACAIAATMGVEVGGLGIGGSTQCADTFPVGVDLGAGEDVSAAGLNLLVDMLERGRA